jgi:hypothetical protein
MFIKLIIISAILVAFVMLALGVKLLFDPDENGICSICQIKDLADCPEKES